MAATATKKINMVYNGSNGIMEQLAKGGAASVPGLSEIIQDCINTYQKTLDEKIGYFCGVGKKKHVFMSIITPEDAKKILERNKINRKVSENYKRTYTKSMSNGKWEATSSMITFDENGNLDDGQHRLESIVASGKSIECAIGCNFNFSIQQDRGFRRTIQHNIYMAHDRLGFTNDCLWDKRLVNMCTCILRHMKMDEKNADVVAEFIKANQNKLEEFAWVMLDDRYPKNGRNAQGYNSASFLSAAFCAYMNGVDLAFLSNIRDVVATGQTNITKDDSGRFDDVTTLRDTVMSYGLADGANKEAYLVESLMYIYAAYNYKKLKGKRAKETAMDRAIKEYAIKYKDSEMIFPAMTDYKKKK